MVEGLDPSLREKTLVAMCEAIEKADGNWDEQEFSGILTRTRKESGVSSKVFMKTAACADGVQGWTAVT